MIQCFPWCPGWFYSDTSNIQLSYLVWLVVLTCFNHLEKYESMGLSHDIMEHKKCVKPPSSSWLYPIMWSSHDISMILQNYGHRLPNYRIQWMISPNVIPHIIPTLWRYFQLSQWLSHPISYRHDTPSSMLINPITIAYHDCPNIFP